MKKEKGGDGRGIIIMSDEAHFTSELNQTKGGVHSMTHL